MIGNIVGLLILIALVVLFAWLTQRAWGSKHKILKWPALILMGLLTLVFALVTMVGAMGTFKLYAPASNPVANIKVAGTPEQIARGAKFAGLCAGCHSTAAKPPLDGSKDDFLSGPDAPPVGSLYAPNLTPAGEIKDWSDGEIIRAIREGVHKSGRPLVIMPSEEFRNLSDADVQSIVAYLRSQRHQEQTAKRCAI
jgi:cytochrome c553